MATFILTAARQIDHPMSHIHIRPGDQFTIRVFDGSSVNANNLFSNRERLPKILDQLGAQGLSGLPSTSVALTGGAWRIKQL